MAISPATHPSSKSFEQSGQARLRQRSKGGRHLEILAKIWPSRFNSEPPASRNAGKGSPRERPFHLTDGSPALVRERLDTFGAAFLADARPGLVFEYGRLVSANVAARRLLGSTSASDSFLEALKVSIGNGVMERDLLFRTRSGVYAPVLHPARNLKGHPTRVCFLIKQRELAPAFAALSARELGVLTLLVKGLTNGQIADELSISIETVRTHVSRAFEKTGTKTRAGLVGRALGR